MARKPIQIEPARYAMTGARLGHAASIRDGFDWQSGPLDAPDFTPAGSLRQGRYYRGSKGKPGHFYISASTIGPRSYD